MGQKCWKLFTTMLFLSAFTFGGGFVIIPLMQRKFVEELGWLTEEEILDMVAFARSSPGAVTVNVAVQVGTRLAGAFGALCGVAGTLIPPLTILSLISLCYDAFRTSPVIAALLYGLRIGVAVVVSGSVATMVSDILRSGERVRQIVMAVALALSVFTSLSTIWILLGSVCLGWVLSRRSAA